MPLYTVYREKQFIKYYNNLWSRATVFVIIFTFVPLFVSLISAYRAYGFYTTTTELLIKPNVSVMSNMYFQFYLANDSMLQWSNYENKTNFVPSISISEVDTDNDGLKDILSLQIKLNQQSVIGVKFFLQFSYLFQSLSIVNIQQPVIITEYSPLPIVQMDVLSRMSLHTKSRLPSAGSFNYQDTNLLEKSDPFAAATTVKSLRNFTLQLDDKFVTKNVAASQTGCVINIDVLYSPQILQFYSEFWYLVKWAWVQWFYFLVIFQFAFQRFKEFTFDSYAVPARKETTIKKKCHHSEYTTEF